MFILGISGPIGHGKSTFADALAELEPSTVHFESGQIIAEVAQDLHEALSEPPDPYNAESLNSWLHVLPEILQKVVNTKCSFKDIELSKNDVEQHPVEYQKLIMHVENLKRNPGMLKTKVTTENKELFRPFLQWLGGYLVKKIDVGIWYNEILRRLHAVDNAGARLCIIGGVRFPTDAAILRSAGATIVTIHRPGHLQSDTLDPTERERYNIKADCEIRSTGGVKDLKRTAKIFVEDLYSKKLKSSYNTS